MEMHGTCEALCACCRIERLDLENLRPDPAIPLQPSPTAITLARPGGAPANFNPDGSAIAVNMNQSRQNANMTD